MTQPYMNPNYYNPYQQQVQPPMDRLAQLQAQQYQQPTMQAQPPQTNQGLLWVQGEAGAKSYFSTKHDSSFDGFRGKPVLSQIHG